MNVFLSRNDNKQDIVIAWTVALLIHVLFFFLTGKMFIKPPQFAIAPTREIDINLIDTPKEESQVQQQARPVIKQVEKIIPKIVKQVVKPIEKLKQVIRSNGQVKVEAKPDYIQNPPPVYPELAKQMHQEGLVILAVDVSRDGIPIKVEIEQSSNYRMLDQAALKAVSHWKFQPGRIGDLSVESNVIVPVRFKLQS